MNTIKDCILSYIENENFNISKIKITDYYKLNQASITLNLSNGETKIISIEKYTTDDESVAEFYDNNLVLVARAKGFDSVL